MLIELNTDNFESEVIKSDLPVVIDFWAEWCGPCRMISPIMDELAKEYHGKVVICKVDVDSNATISGKYGVRNIPTVLFLKNGEVVDKQVGAVPKKRFVEKIETLL